MADPVGPVLTALTALVGAALTPTPGRLLSAPGGEVAWDSCCDGMAWVRVKSVEAANTTSQCGPTLWVVTFGAGALRCAATVDDRGRAPKPATLTAEALQMTADQGAIASALACANIQWLNLISWEPLGPQGGCVGGEWTLTVKIPTCACPPEVPVA